MIKRISKIIIKKYPYLQGKIFIFLRLYTLLMGKIFLKLEVRGVNNFKDIKPGGTLFIANHHGYWDPFLIGSVLPYSYLKNVKRLRFMTAENYINNKWYGSLISFVGAYCVYKSGGDYKKSLAETIRLLKDRQDVLLFPNGKRDIEFYPKNTKSGIAYLANILNLQIIPVYISNTYKITFIDFIFRKKKVIINFGKKIEVKEILNGFSTYKEQAIEMTKKIEILKQDLMK